MHWRGVCTGEASATFSVRVRHQQALPGVLLICLVHLVYGGLHEDQYVHETEKVL